MLIFKVIANKSDQADCMSIDEISEGLGTATIPPHVTWTVLRASGKTRDGVGEALVWITERMPACQARPAPKPRDDASKIEPRASVLEWFKRLFQ